MLERSISGSRQLAARAGIGVGTAADLLSGKAEPRLSTMLALVQGLELGSIEELIVPLGTNVILLRGSVVRSEHLGRN